MQQMPTRSFMLARASSTGLSAVAVLLLLLACCIVGTHAQFSSIATPGSPAGFDAVGQQIALKTAGGPVACTAATFPGYLCTNSTSKSSAGFGGLRACPSGYVCPSPTDIYISPAGYSTAMTHSVSDKCKVFSACPEGTYKPRYFTMLIVMLVCFVGTIIAYQVGHCIVGRRATARQEAMKNASSSTNLTRSITIQQRSGGGGAGGVASAKGLRAAGEISSFSQVRISIALDNVCVQVRNTEGAQAAAPDASVASARATESEAAWAGQGEGERDVENPAPVPTAAVVEGKKKGAPAAASMRTILRSVSGTIRGGRLTAIMGASGAGKTTCLSALLGKVPLSSGSILVNHQHSVAEVLRKHILGFVPQGDVMLPMLTVHELLMHSALMRLPGDWSRQRKEQRVDDTMQLLGISHLRDVVVGDESDRGISGGEKKRVSIGLELVSDPQILLLDEPTTGLDASAAMNVVAGLQSVCLQGKVVACVVHQPRWEIFSLFQDVLLLAKGGHPVYFGPVEELQPFFAHMGLVTPANTNPADFLIDTLADEQFLAAWTKGGANEVRKQALAQGRIAALPASAADDTTKPVPSTSSKIATPSDPSSAGMATLDGASIVRVHFSPQSSQLQREPLALALPQQQLHDMQEVELAPMAKPAQQKQLGAGDVDEEKSGEQKPRANAKLSSYTSSTPLEAVVPASFFAQTWYLIWRFALIDMRQGRFMLYDSLLQLIPAAALAISSLADESYAAPLPAAVASTCFSMVADKCMDETTSQGLLVTRTFFYSMIIGVAAMLWAVSCFARRMTVFHRDTLSGMNVGAYVLARCLYDLIHWSRMAFVFTSVFYLMAAPLGGVTGWFGTIWLLYWAAGGMGYFVGVVVPLHRGATAIGIVAAVATSVTSGLLPTLKTVSHWNVLRVFWYISYNRWGAEALVLLGADVAHQKTNGRMEHAISAAGYDADNYSVDLALVFIIGLAWRIATYLAIRRAKPQTEF